MVIDWPWIFTLVSLWDIIILWVPKGTKNSGFSFILISPSPTFIIYLLEAKIKAETLVAELSTWHLSLVSSPQQAPYKTTTSSAWVIHISAGDHGAFKWSLGGNLTPWNHLELTLYMFLCIGMCEYAQVYISVLEKERQRQNRGRKRGKSERTSRGQRRLLVTNLLDPSAFKCITNYPACNTVFEV